MGKKPIQCGSLGTTGILIILFTIDAVWSLNTETNNTHFNFKARQVLEKAVWWILFWERNFFHILS